ncbi:cyclase family protein [Dactylosporangium sp. CA-092794]|uniref:cyclase family protein n=1 Tax=Dactylosporangium sp. CA-092794 TaxID=3239929 RepID=UPI003D920C67
MNDTGASFPTNWGRWGDSDELGAINFITARARVRGVAEARTGVSVSIARTTRPAALIPGPMAPTQASSTAVQTAMMFTGNPPVAMAELMVITTHHPEVTHLDAMAHMVLDGHVYPGVPQADSSGPAGVRHGATDAYADGILTRGVLLDLAPGGRLPAAYPVTAADLDAAAAREGVSVQSGDALIVRGGWDWVTERDRPLPGITEDAVRWMSDHEIAIYAGDIGDARPPIKGHIPGALHMLALGRLGIPLIDGADPSALADMCARQGRHTFLFVAATPRIFGMTGLPVNPLAIF